MSYLPTQSLTVPWLPVLGLPSFLLPGAARHVMEKRPSTSGQEESRESGERNRVKQDQGFGCGILFSHILELEVHKMAIFSYKINANSHCDVEVFSNVKMFYLLLKSQRVKAILLL